MVGPVRKSALMSRLELGISVGRTLGPRWLAERAMITASERLGTVQRKTPVATWSASCSGGSTRRPDLLDRSAASTYLAARPSTVAQLRREFGQLTDRRFKVFGALLPVHSWHIDPVSGAKYDQNLHWSHVKEHSEADLKLVWEPSRFGWAFDLARLHVAEPDSGAAELFWELFEDWCAANQPHAGVNWKCGQESSIRLMAVVFAADAFAGVGETPERERLLAAFADVTARRVLAHWHYAKHQRNNHIVSEAVGLLTAAYVFPDLEIAPEAGAIGERLLVDACDELVFDDGGTSQYSANYHRVFLQNFLWAQMILRHCAEPIPVLDDAIERSAALLNEITDPTSGRTANFGQNDGALLLPVSDADFGDMRPTLRAAGIHTGSDDGDSSELAVWLGNHEPSGPDAEPAPRSGNKLFPDMGLAVLEKDSNRAVIRGTRFTSRPSHSDQMHADLWIDGTHVVIDPGTYSYKPIDGQPNLSSSASHNGPMTDAREDMQRVSRFLFVNWSKVSVQSFDPRNSRWVGLHESPHLGTSVRRIVERFEAGWSITDQVHAGKVRYLSATWLLPTDEIEMDAHRIRFVVDGKRFELSTRSEAGTTSDQPTISTSPTMWCPSYRTTLPATAVTVEVAGSSRMNTTFTATS